MQVSDRLPRGRHSLSRDEVVRSQLDRIKQGTIESVAEQGYNKASVSDIVKRAGVSLQTFYAHFKNKHECYAATYDWAGEVLLTEILQAQGELPPETTPAQRVDSYVATHLAHVARDPVRARAILVEVYSAGPELTAQWLATRKQFTLAAAAMLGRESPDDLFQISAYVAAVAGLIFELICDGRADEAESLRVPLARLARVSLHREGLAEDDEPLPKADEPPGLAPSV